MIKFLKLNNASLIIMEELKKLLFIIEIHIQEEQILSLELRDTEFLVIEI